VLSAVVRMCPIGHGGEPCRRASSAGRPRRDDGVCRHRLAKLLQRTQKTPPIPPPRRPGGAGIRSPADRGVLDHLP
jgi:hypothetical protein